VQEMDDCCEPDVLAFADEWHDACSQWRREESSDEENGDG